MIHGSIFNIYFGSKCGSLVKFMSPFLLIPLFFSKVFAWLGLSSEGKKDGGVTMPKKVHICELIRYNFSQYFWERRKIIFNFLSTCMLHFV